MVWEKGVQVSSWKKVLKWNACFKKFSWKGRKNPTKPGKTRKNPVNFSGWFTQLLEQAGE
jgi:hypothetical protein